MESKERTSSGRVAECRKETREKDGPGQVGETAFRSSCLSTSDRARKKKIREKERRSRKRNWCGRESGEKESGACYGWCKEEEGTELGCKRGKIGMSEKGGQKRIGMKKTK